MFALSYIKATEESILYLLCFSISSAFVFFKKKNLSVFSKGLCLRSMVTVVFIAIIVALQVLFHFLL